MKNKKFVVIELYKPLNNLITDNLSDLGIESNDIYSVTDYKDVEETLDKVKDKEYIALMDNRIGDSDLIKKILSSGNTVIMNLGKKYDGSIDENLKKTIEENNIHHVYKSSMYFGAENFFKHILAPAGLKRI